METLEIKAAGKAWSVRSVAGQTEADFVKDPAHAVEGLSPAENTIALKGVYAACAEAVKVAGGPAAPAEATPAEGKKK